MNPSPSDSFDSGGRSVARRVRVICAAGGDPLPGPMTLRLDARRIYDIPLKGLPYY